MYIWDVFMCKEGIIALFMACLVYCFLFQRTRKKMKIYKKHCEKLEEMLAESMEINNKFSALLDESVGMLKEQRFPEFEAVGRNDFEG